jgi:hypothetical protein
VSAHRKPFGPPRPVAVDAICETPREWVARHTEDAEKRLELERAAGTIV